MPLLLLLVMFLGVLAPTKAADDDRFLTNLALLDVLAMEAVEQVLDSLRVAAGDSIGVLADGYNEGNGFVADAFARSLARRGCSVRMLAGVAATPQEAPEAPAGGKAPADADSLPDDPDEEDNEDEAPEDQPEDQIDQDEEDQQDDSDTDLFNQDPFADDSTAVSDSTLWATAQDTTATEDDPTDEGTEEEPSDAAQPEAAPSTLETIAAGRVYPPGTTLEFQVLEFGVTYPEVKRRFLLLGTSSIGRLAGVYVQARRIEGPDGEIVQVVSGQSHHRDRLSGHSRVLAEGAGYPFEQPTVPPGRIGKLAEPIVVVGIIVSLVYLFYQNQN